MQDKWINSYQQLGALWIHDGNKKRPHAKLASGNCSNGFFNSGNVTEDPQLLNEACHDLAALLRGWPFDIGTINRVIGPSMGAITIAHSVAWSITRLSGRLTKNRCLTSFTEKDGDDNQILKRTTLKEKEVVLAVEDVITTGGSVEKTINSISGAGGELIPFILTLVNRSGLTHINGKQIVALIDKPMPMWAPNECPLCKDGSVAIRPKGAEAWHALNADY